MGIEVAQNISFTELSKSNNHTEKQSNPLLRHHNKVIAVNHYCRDSVVTRVYVEYERAMHQSDRCLSASPPANYSFSIHQSGSLVDSDPCVPGLLFAVQTVFWPLPHLTRSRSRMPWMLCAHRQMVRMKDVDRQCRHGPPIAVVRTAIVLGELVLSSR